MTPHLLDGLDIIHQRVHVGSNHLSIGFEVPRRLKMRIWLAPFSPPAVAEVLQWIQLRVGHVRVSRQIPADLEQTRIVENRSFIQGSDFGRQGSNFGADGSVLWAGAGQVWNRSSETAEPTVVRHDFVVARKIMKASIFGNVPGADSL